MTARALAARIFIGVVLVVAVVGGVALLSLNRSETAGDAAKVNKGDIARNQARITTNERKDDATRRCQTIAPDVQRCIERVVGAQGPGGATGRRGGMGARGLNGLRGRAGKAGKAGKAGERGQRGARGGDGPRGRDGKDGKDGKDGRDGRDGLDGAKGLDAPPAPPTVITQEQANEAMRVWCEANCTAPTPPPPAFCDPTLGYVCQPPPATVTTPP
jgi:hypothetical protein